MAKPPAEGDRIRVAINQPDGTQSFVDLTAKASSTPGATDTMPVFATAAEAADLPERPLQDRARSPASRARPPSAIQADFGAGTPASLTLGVTGTPVAGDTVTVNVALRDGTTQTLTLTARRRVPTQPPPPSSPLQRRHRRTTSTSAVNNALKGAASTTLAASSASRASQDFFAGSPSAGLAPRRISADGNGYAEQASTKTVIWYTGDDTAADPRATATAQIERQPGAQHRRAGQRGADPDRARRARHDRGRCGHDGRRRDAGGPALQRARRPRPHPARLEQHHGAACPGIASDLGLAASTLSNTKTENRTNRAALQGSLDGVETISAKDVTAQLLQLQTQLQASYQVTSMLSKLNLVNYLS